MSYAHTQRGHFQWLLWASTGVMFTVAYVYPMEEQPWVRYTLIGSGALTLILSLGLLSLTVRDEGTHLGIRFGPLPLLRRRVAYDDIESVAAGRSSVMDGWGVHWVPGRGWIWNLWGFDCVELTVAGKRMRIGSDDAHQLVAFLAKRIGGNPA